MYLIFFQIAVSILLWGALRIVLSRKNLRYSLFGMCILFFIIATFFPQLIHFLHEFKYYIFGFFIGEFIFEKFEKPRINDFYIKNNIRDKDISEMSLYDVYKEEKRESEEQINKRLQKYNEDIKEYDRRLKIRKDKYKNKYK